MPKKEPKEKFFGEVYLTQVANGFSVRVHNDYRNGNQSQNGVFVAENFNSLQKLLKTILGL